MKTNTRENYQYSGNIIKTGKGSYTSKLSGKRWRLIHVKIIYKIEIELEWWRLILVKINNEKGIEWCKTRIEYVRKIREYHEHISRDSIKCSLNSS